MECIALSRSMTIDQTDGYICIHISLLSIFQCSVTKWNLVFMTIWSIGKCILNVWWIEHAMIFKSTRVRQKKKNWKRNRIIVHGMEYPYQYACCEWMTKMFGHLSPFCGIYYHRNQFKVYVALGILNVIDPQMYYFIILAYTPPLVRNHQHLKLKNIDKIQINIKYSISIKI